MYELIIEGGRTEQHYWRDLWQFRELFKVLAWRDSRWKSKVLKLGNSPAGASI